MQTGPGAGETGPVSRAHESASLARRAWPETQQESPAETEGEARGLPWTRADCAVRPGPAGACRLLVFVQYCGGILDVFKVFDSSFLEVF